MGKGDVGSRRGKIWRGTYGNTRPHKADRNDNDKKPQKNGPTGRKGK